VPIESSACERAFAAYVTAIAPGTYCDAEPADGARDAVKEPMLDDAAAIADESLEGHAAELCVVGGGALGGDGCVVDGAIGGVPPPPPPPPHAVKTNAARASREMNE
jgi:hypothetical protein